jgi:hypothetical protein
MEPIPEADGFRGKEHGSPEDTVIQLQEVAKPSDPSAFRGYLVGHPFVPGKRYLKLPDPDIRITNYTPNGQRIFSYGTPWLYFLQSLAVIASIASDVAVAVVNVAMGKFIRLLGDTSVSGPRDNRFMDSVSTTA